LFRAADARFARYTGGMSLTVTVRDETAAGRAENEWTLDFLSERVTVREVIRSRVYQEVKDYNAKQGEHFRGLVQPTDAEQTLNGYRMRKRRPIDWNKQFERALEAFSTNGFLLLIDDRQRDDLDEEVVLTPKTEISFVKLMPLVGG
jgi:hypothetical protein